MLNVGLSDATFFDRTLWTNFVLFSPVSRVLFLFFFVDSSTNTQLISLPSLQQRTAKFTNTRRPTSMHDISSEGKITIKSDWMAVNKFGVRSILQTLVFCSIHQFGHVWAPDKLLNRDMITGRETHSLPYGLDFAIRLRLRSPLNLHHRNSSSAHTYTRYTF